MAKNIYQVSIANSFYFSFATFFIIWTANFLFDILKKTTGQLSVGATIFIILSLVLVIFIIAIINIILGEETFANNSLLSKCLAVLLFMILSAIIIGVLGMLFFYEF
jgi:hypothetical protein